jgi:hypothetical protein
VLDALAWVGLAFLVLFIAAVLAYCVWRAARNAKAPRDADARAGSYSIPHVVQITGARDAVLLLALVGVASLALALWVHRLAGIGALAVILFGYVLLWVYSRYRVTLDEDTFTYRQFLREHVIRYEDIASVRHDLVATGAAGGVLVLLRLGFVDQRKPIDIQVSALPERERAIIVHRLLQKATKASFSPELHLLWTGAF